jgi:hypothetical protein
MGRGERRSAFKTHIDLKALDRDGGDDRIRTGEWGFCRPLPYHLATSPQDRL